MQPFTPIPGMNCVQHQTSTGYSMTCTQPRRNTLGLFGFLPLAAAIRHFLEYSGETNPTRAQIQLLAGYGQLGLAVVAFGSAYLL